MKIRRIVVAIDAEGCSVLQSDVSAERIFQSLEGFSSTPLWATPAAPEVGPSKGTDPVPLLSTTLPETGGSRLFALTLPPDTRMLSADFDAAAYFAEIQKKIPDFAATFEPDTPGMHRTDTIDYAVVLSGEIWLELDRGKEIRVSSGEVVIQNGGRHAWRNKSPNPATILITLLGASRA